MKFYQSKKITIVVVLIIGLVGFVSLVQQTQILKKKAATLPETLYYVHTNHLGSTTIITNTSGNAVSSRVYFPYGTTRTSSGSNLTDRLYTGQVSDTDETGLYYYNARFYNPTIAKFTQADTINDQLNRYAYVGNNPVTRIDPTGKRFDDLDEYPQKPQPTPKPIPPTHKLIPDAGIDDNAFYIPGANDPKYNIYVQQEVEKNHCGVASTTMLLTNWYQRHGIEVDPDQIYQAAEEFYTIPPDSRGIDYDDILSYLDFLGLNAKAGGRPVTADKMQTHLRTYGVAIVDIAKDYDPEGGSNHFIVLVGVRKIGWTTYIEVSDPYRTVGGWTKPGDVPGVKSLPNGNLLVPYQTLKKTLGGVFVYLDEFPAVNTDSRVKKNVK